MSAPLTPEEEATVRTAGAGWCSEKMWERVWTLLDAARAERDEALMLSKASLPTNVYTDEIVSLQSALAERTREVEEAREREKSADVQLDAVRHRAEAAETALAEARADAFEEAAKIADAEPEFPGPMPSHLWAVTEENPEAGLRAACRVTKQAISRAIRARGGPANG